MATVLRPKVLIADEATSSLDVTTQAQILLLFRELARTGTAIVFISHDLAVVADLSDRIAVLQAGRLVEEGRTAEVLRAPRHPYTAGLCQRARLPARAASMVASDGALRIEAHNLVVDYTIPPTALGGTTRIRALSGVSLAVRAGERVGVVGESGSGKSTLMRALLGLERLAHGELHIAGARFPPAARGDVRRLRRTLGAVFQDPVTSFDPKQRMATAVAEPLNLLDPSPGAAARREKAAVVLAQMGLVDGLHGRFPHELSGGERQRAALARAFIIAPRLVILDEAFSALDVSLRVDVLDLLDREATTLGSAYLFISHDLALIRATTDRVLVMQSGQIVEAGSTETVFSSPSHPYTRSLVEASLDLDEVLARRMSGAASASATR
jgi:peptide/nickel transport system ATP-binding protein